MAKRVSSLFWFYHILSRIFGSKAHVRSLQAASKFLAPSALSPGMLGTAALAGAVTKDAWNYPTRWGERAAHVRSLWTTNPRRVNVSFCTVWDQQQQDIFSFSKDELLHVKQGFFSIYKTAPSVWNARKLATLQSISQSLYLWQGQDAIHTYKPLTWFSDVFSCRFIPESCHQPQREGTTFCRWLLLILLQAAILNPRCPVVRHCSHCSPQEIAPKFG